MAAEYLEQPLPPVPAEPARPRPSTVRTQPTELTGCLELTPANRDRLGMIVVKSAAMRARIDYLTAAARRTIPERVMHFLRGVYEPRWLVTKDYFLSYHKEEPAVSGRAGTDRTEYTVRRVLRKNKVLYEIYAGEDRRKPDRVVKSELKLHKLGYPDEVVFLLRQLFARLPRSRAADVYRQIGDSIIQRTVITRRVLWRRSTYAMIVSTYYKGASRDSRRFFEKGFLPIESLLPPGGRAPHYIVIDAGPNPEFFPRPSRLLRHSATRFVIIPGEINIKTYQDTIVPYVGERHAATDFLAATPRFERIARQAGISDEIIKADNLFVSRRSTLPLKAVLRVFTEVIRAHRILRMTVAGNLLFSFFYGIQEGAIVNPLMAMIENRFMVLGAVTILALYFYPVVESLIEIRSGIKFDEVRNAEKSRRLPRVYINEELRAVQLRVALFYTAASAVLILLYPGIFLRLFGNAPAAVTILFLLFFSNKLFRDWAEYYEANNDFRVLIRTVGRDPVHHGNLLKVRSFELGLRMLLRVTGLALGMGLMWAHPVAALAIAGLGILVGCGSKYVYPLFGAEHSVSVSTDRRPFLLDNHNVALVPGMVRMKVQRDPRFEPRGRRWISLDPPDFEIIVDGAAPASEPVIRAYPGNTFSSLNRKWRLTWHRRCTVTIELHDERPLELVRRESGQQVRYLLAPAKPRS